MNEKAIRIATRSSELAMWQANWVKGRLEALGKSVELVPVLTQGDREQAAFRDMRGVGFFTKAVQDAVLSNKADLAVHSYKDLPSAQAPGLEIAAVSERADPRDVLLVRPEAFHPEDAPLPLMEGARVGTSAPRRQAQLRQLRPDLRVAELRGNVPSRIRKLREGEYDAVLLAAAGLARLGLEPADLRRHALTPEVFVPAPAQGVLALECRKGDFELASLLTDLHSPETYRMLLAERGLMALIQGGCQLALGAHATAQQGGVELRAWYGGRQVLVEHASPEAAAMLAFEALGRPDPAEARA